MKKARKGRPLKWNAIFSAPRDGSKIIAISTDSSMIEILYWDGGRGSWIDMENDEAGTNLGLYAGWIPAPEWTPDCAIVNSPCPIEYAYIGIKDGTIRAIVVDDTRYPDDTANLVSDWIKMGRTVERMPIDQAVARMKI